MKTEKFNIWTFKYDVSNSEYARWHDISQKAMDNAISQITSKATNVIVFSQPATAKHFIISVNFNSFGVEHLTDLYFTFKTGKLSKTASIY